jgi:hypothetical protein
MYRSNIYAMWMGSPLLVRITAGAGNFLLGSAET